VRNFVDSLQTLFARDEHAGICKTMILLIIFGCIFGSKTTTLWVGGSFNFKIKRDGKILYLLTAVFFFVACNNPTSHSNTDVKKGSVQTISHGSTNTKPATTDTSAKSMGKDATNPNYHSQK
jgi:hypothetical protein